jgi:hypothetical protein
LIVSTVAEHKNPWICVDSSAGIDQRIFVGKTDGAAAKQRGNK